MVTIRAAAAALLFVVLSLIGSTGGPVLGAPAGGTPLSGSTRDAAGRALAGVEVLVLSDARAGAAILRSISDERGRFLLGTLDPGVYRIAAIKSGYVAALGRVNTLLRSSVDLVLHPIPKPGEPGSPKVVDDLSWTLRVPPRSILREVEATAMLSTHGTGGARAFVERVGDSLRGEVEHTVAMGSWRPTADGPASSLEGMETSMRLAGSIGERGLLQVRGCRGRVDSSPRTAGAAVTRDAADVDVAMNYDTSSDTNLAVNAFYSRGDLQVGGDPTGAKGPSRQGQRSWGYDASWKKQVDPSSRVAVQVGFHDSSLDVADPEFVGDASLRDASNRAIGAEGSYETFAGEGHLLRVGLRAQRLSLSVPEARIGPIGGSFRLEGEDGWSVLVDAQDQWSLSAPWALTYGMTVRQALDGPLTTYAAPRLGGTWTASRLRAHAEISYLAVPAASRAAAPVAPVIASPVGYDLLVETPLGGGVTLSGSAGYVPLRADRWADGQAVSAVNDVYVTDGMASDRFFTVAIERLAATVAVSLRVAHGRADGAIAPAFDNEMPAVLLADRSLVYDAARLGTRASRSGSSLALEYRAVRQLASSVDDPLHGDPLRTVELQFAQDLVRLAGGRATCRLLLAGRTVVESSYPESAVTGESARQFAALQRRMSAGLSLSF